MSELRPKPRYGAAYKRARRAMLAGRPLCTYCDNLATEADHVPPLALHDHRAGSGCCRIVPSCAEHGRAQGPKVRDLVAAQGPPPEPDVPVDDDPEGWDAADPVWDVHPWLQEFRDVPADATWPRFMSAPHPNAVASLGPEFVAYAEERSGRPLRWWQRLVAYRLLEIDVEGAFVWETLLLTVARQVGKSWLLRELCLWRLHQGARFAEPQDIMHTAKDLNVCHEIQRPARTWAKHRTATYKVRETNGKEEIEFLADGSRWMLRAKEAVYGYAVSLAVVDEAWDVSASSVDEGLIPTMTERTGAQLVLVTTAHRRATGLVVKRRALALAALATPDTDLILEWSAPPEAPIESVATWRTASPHWTPRRQRMVRARLDAALSGATDDPDEPDPMESFRAQWLNQLPRRTVKPSKGEPLLASGWPRPPKTEPVVVGPVVVAVEDWFGTGAAAACVAPVGNRFVVGGWAFDTRVEAYGWARFVLDQRPGSVLVVGATLAGDPEFDEWGAVTVTAAGTADTRAGLSLLRELVDGGRVIADESPDVGDQVKAARVVTGTAGLTLVPGPRADLLRAVVWGLRVATRQPVGAPDILRAG